MGVKVGVIGLGGISKFHLEGYKNADADIVWVADLNQDLAKEVASKYSCRYTADYHKLLEEAEIEAVSVCTPNYEHYPVAVDVLDAGKHVLCEKPMTTTIEHAEKLVQRVQEGGRIFQIAYMKRFIPAFKLAKESLCRIGELETAHVRVYHPAPSFRWEHPEEMGWFLVKEQAGGCALAHSGSHLIDIMRWLCGDPVRVDARSQKKPNLDVDYMTTAFFELESGETIFFEAYWQPLSHVGIRNNGWDEWIEINGDRGRLEVFTTRWNKPGEDSPFMRLYTEEKGTTETFYTKPTNYFTEEVKAFVSSVKSGSKPSPDVVDGYRAQALIDATYRSAETRKPVEVRYRF